MTSVFIRLHEFRVMTYLRNYRMFHADVTLNAPKDRTLFDYNCIEDGWPKLRDFLALPQGKKDEPFPHENKTTDMTLHEGSFAYTMFDGEKHGKEYDNVVESEIIDYMRRNGYDCKKVKE